jgi:methyl-accepting chemotaxis protein
MFTNLRLQAKIIITAITISLFYILVLALIGYFSYLNQYEKAAASIADEMRQDVKYKLESKLDIGLTNALSASANKDLIKAVEFGDKAFTNQILNRVSDTHKKLIGQTTKIHIHTPENHSFLRSWKSKNGDSLQSFRFGVQKVIDEKKAIKVMELGRAGLAIRGIVPLFSGSDRYLGSLEYIISTTSLAKDYKKDDKRYLLLLNSEALKISTKAKDNTKVGSYVIASKKGYDPEAIKMAQTMDWDALNKNGWITHNGYLITQIKTQDLRGKMVGTQIIAEPEIHLAEVADSILASTLENIISNLVVVILMVLILISVIRSSVIKPVKCLQKAFGEVITKGNFSARVPTNQSADEVNSMSKDFNSLMQNLEQIIQSITSAMGEIKNGNLSTRVDVSAHGELESLKNSVNDTADILESTMSEITRVLSEMEQSNFSVDINHIDSKGSFNEALNSMQQTLKSLKTAVKEINDSVEHMSHSNFSHPVTANLSGDLGALKENLNNALSSLQNGFNSFTSSLTQLSSGDLTTTVDGDYRGQLANLQDIINNSLSNIASMFTEIKITAENARQNVDLVNRGNADLNSRTQNQAASLEETAASSEEITSTVKNSLQNAFEANELAQKAKADANEGSQVMSEAQNAMESIREASAKISDITGLIDSIAFQTNLLALNAAVEAARAGEHGRGFAVVAGEVRNLAQKAADAAKEISDLVSDTTNRINHGSELAERSSEMLSQINDRISTVSQKMDEITRAAEEQSQGMGQINDAISSIDEITQQNTSLVDRVSTSTEEANNQVTRLVELAAAFKVDTQKLSLGTTVQTGDFTFARARRAHRDWRSHMSTLLHTGSTDVDMTKAVDSHSCELGKWLDDIGQKYSNMPEFSSLMEAHDKLHNKINEGLKSLEDNASEIPSDQVAEIEDLSDQVIQAINNLEKAVANNTDQISS